MISEDYQTRQALAYEFIEEHGVAYSFSFEYDGGTHWSGFYESQESLLEAEYQYLKSIEYKPRKFWQFWRRESQIPQKIRERLKADEKAATIRVEGETQ